MGLVQYYKLMIILVVYIIFLFFACRNRIINKRINVRVEHVRPSRCQDDFYKRVKENDAKRIAAKERGEKIAVSGTRPLYVWFN